MADDLSGLSTEELWRMRRDAQQPPQSDLSSMSTEDLWKMRAQQSMTSGEVAADIAKSAAIGVPKGTIGIAGMPGDVANYLNRGIDYALGRAADVTGYEALRPSPEQLAKREQPLLGSQQIRRGVEAVTGPLYEPKTTAGQYAQTAGEFLPAALAGPGTLARRIVGGAIVPGLASEAAGQTAQAVAPGMEPYARMAG